MFLIITATIDLCDYQKLNYSFVNIKGILDELYTLLYSHIYIFFYLNKYILFFTVYNRICKYSRMIIGNANRKISKRCIGKRISFARTDRRGS